MKRPGRSTLLRIGLGVLAVAVVVQVLPIGGPRTNPAVIQDAPWPDERSRTLARDACYACHSNETRWPLYSYVAPMKWLVVDDVNQGREALNFSDWEEAEGEADDGAEAVLDGSMPPTRFQLLHAGARLDEADRQALGAALEAMAGEDRDADRTGETGQGGDDGNGGRGRGRGRGRGGDG